MESKQSALRACWAPVLLTWACGLAGCSPALDWREVRAPGTAVLALMPCKPATQQRQLLLASSAVAMSLQACSAAGVAWGLVSADVADPARVGAALDELLAASARNVSAAVAADRAFAPAGSTPNARSRRARLTGTLPDGSQVVLESAVFSHGTWVFQATVLGEQAGDEAADNFFASLRVAP